MNVEITEITEKPKKQRSEVIKSADSNKYRLIVYTDGDSLNSLGFKFTKVELNALYVSLKDIFEHGE